MKTDIIVDTGPLVALGSSRDTHHAWALEMSRATPPPWFTVEPVVAEAAFLLSRSPEAVFALLELISSGALKIGLALGEEAPEIERLMRRYHDVPMSLADGALVRLSELRRNSSVMTLDRDFEIYRRHRTRQIPLIAPY